MGRMKERPIPFSYELLPAIIAGSKTMTRRVIQPQPQFFDLGDGVNSSWYVEWCHPRTGCIVAEWGEGEPVPQSILDCCPYGRAGDRLWVKEAWAVSPFLNKKRPGEIHPATQVLYKAGAVKISSFMWRSGRFMPRWASRLNLEIVQVRVERVQAISLCDIEAEGIPHNPMRQASYRNDEFQRIQDFKWLWDAINSKRGFGWTVNPWVWVIEFKKVQ